MESAEMTFHGDNLPDICRMYNTRMYCHNTNCRALHVCYWEVMGRCRSPNCSRSHTIYTERDIDILQTLGWSSAQVSTVPSKLRTQFARGENKPDDATTTPRVCLFYATGYGCTYPKNRKCFRFHICHNYVRGRCLLSCCDFDHDIQSNEHNRALIAQYFPLLSQTQILQDLSDDLSTVTVMPPICLGFVDGDNCIRKCWMLHCCRFIARHCKQFGCTRPHHLLSPHNQRVLRFFNLDATRALQLLKVD